MSIANLITRNGTSPCPIPSGGVIGWGQRSNGSFCLAKRSVFEKFSAFDAFAREVNNYIKPIIRYNT